jgi:predicted house-cleaning noncanonical NTP pyrophosphatase (MazG superfamily)
LIETRRYLKQQAREIKNLSTELEAKMGVSKSVFISQGKELKDRLVAKMIKLQESHKEELETLPDVGNFVNEVVPAYESSTMQIDNFRELQQKGEAIYSSPLSFCGLSFRLKVLPVS